MLLTEIRRIGQGVGPIPTGKHMTDDPCYRREQNTMAKLDNADLSRAE